MTSDWTPEGYSSPREYTKSEFHILVIGLIMAGIFGIAVFRPVMAGASAYVQVWSDLARSTGLSHPFLIVFGGILGSIVGILILFVGIVIPIHEWLHYEVARQLDLNPDFVYGDFLFFKNPSVVALSTDIPIWKNLAMLITPFVVIGIFSWVLIQVSSGLLAGMGAVVLWINSAASAQDLYHCSRILRMNPDTRFANFEEDGKIRTEYAIPER